MKQVILLVGIAASCVVVDAQDIDLGTVTERHEMIPMRDGKLLSAYLYVPSGSGPWPAVFEQRYADLRAAGTRKAAAKLAEAGYVVALVNFRGTHLSEGTWVGYRALGWGDLKDGYDTCEWLAAQPWCTSGVGTFGSSQGGYTQNFLAVTQPPHLKCQYMVDTGLSLFQEGYRIGGVTRPERFTAMDKICRDPQDNRRLMEEWFRHPNYDEFWKQEDCSLHFDRMNVPCFTIGSWYDFMNQGSIASFRGRQQEGGPNSRGQQQLVIGPWLHGRLNKGHKVGDLTYPENAAFAEYDHMVHWFDHWLKGRDNGIERDPAVRYYMMGACGEAGAPGNVWRTAVDFPPLAAATSLYLQGGGALSTNGPTGAEGATSYISDPRHPMELLGTAFPGAKDARAFEQQAEVRTFTTEPLAEPVEWTGRIRAELYVSSTARDTDFLVRISDVYPDGRSILICDYPLRARYREGFDREALLEPGKVHQLAYDIGWISQVFNRGHRIRATIASTGAPLYEPNPQTGGPQTIDFPAAAQKAENTIHHNRSHASRIIAPVMTSAPRAEIAPAVRYVAANPAAGSSSAVIVRDQPLIYTTQVFPEMSAGSAAAFKDARRQTESALRVLDAKLKEAGSDLSRVVKLNVYANEEGAAADALQALAERFSGAARPAVSIVASRLAQSDALVALDAVVVCQEGSSQLSAVKRQVGAAILPSGGRVFVSGQAERSGSMRDCTRKTLEGLSATLKHCGRSDNDIVQLKCFLPVNGVAEAKAEIERYFANGPQPPVVFVEWTAAAPPIEIELVAWGGPANAATKDVVDFLTPPGMTKSPVYSRVTRVHRGGLIFIGDLFGPPGAATEEQVKAPFEQLDKVLKQAGSGFEHLAKATYYVTDDEVGKAHNAIRPHYFNADRPPAASKALVRSTGRAGSRYSMDMIAIPHE